MNADTNRTQLRYYNLNQRYGEKLYILVYLYSTFQVDVRI